MLMSNTKRPVKPRRLEGLGLSLAAAAWLSMPSLAHADVKLSNDWNEDRTCTGSARTNAELAEMQQGLRPRSVCTKTEPDKVRDASALSATARSAAMSRTKPTERGFNQYLGFKMQLDGLQHYLEPVGFMTKSRPDEVCTPSDFKGQPTYRCDEGQRHTVDCHILIFNDKFEEVGYHRIVVKEPYQFYCNAVPAVGVGDSANNLVLATIQYFPIDRKHASTVAEVGQGWNRMTVALRLKRQADGHVLIEQEDDCLGNPNRIDTVPDAKRLLRKCAAQRK